MAAVSDHSLNWEELGRLLEAFRLRKGLTRPQMWAKLKQNWVEDRDRWRRLRRAMLRYSSRLIRLIERKTTTLVDSFRWSDPDATTLANLYGVTPLMLDWLRSENRDGECLVIDEDDWVKLRQSGSKFYGMGTRYSVPTHKYPMKRTDVAFGLLDLHANGAHSSAHCHPGEEILICKIGAVRVRFPHSGISVDLQPGDFVHFWSEMQHDATNIRPRGKSSLFVVRYYQVVQPGTRSVIREQLKGAGASTQQVINQLTRMGIRDEILEAEDERVADPIGLGRLLERIALNRFEGRAKRGQPTVAYGTLVERLKAAAVSIELLSAKSIKTGRRKYLRTQVHFIRLHRGELSVKKSDLGMLAKVYGVQPMIFYDYLHFSEPGIVVVRQQDYKPVHLVKKRGVRYLACGRRLALSDIAILQVSLAPGQQTPENYHSGFEAIVALEEEVGVMLPPTKEPYTVGSGPAEYAFFDSSRSHAVINRGKKPARFFVLRFYQ